MSVVWFGEGGSAGEQKETVAKDQDEAVKEQFTGNLVQAHE